jgi:hypothetical protein
VYIIGGDYNIERMFLEAGAAVAMNLAECNIAVWTGGADVSPKLYGELKHPRTFVNEQRDAYEQACYAKSEGKFRVGICRGGQFLNIMNKGKMWQDVDNHAIRGTHEVTYVNAAGLKRAYNVTSTHHQMMIPAIREGGAAVWAWANLASTKACGIKDKDGNWLTFKYDPGSGKNPGDAEVVYYKNTRSLCFQPHPEYSSESCRELFFKCVERALAA